MKFGACIVTRSGSIQVHTLRCLLKLPLEVALEWCDESDQTDTLARLLGKYDRLMWVGYGIHAEFIRILNPALGQVVVPSPKGVDWERFVSSGTKEPVHQRGLTWDTTVDKSGHIVKTQPRLWAVNTRPLLKKIKKNPLPPYERFWSWMQHVAGQKIQVLGSMPVSMVFSHELKA